jgi:hypothetical protein
MLVWKACSRRLTNMPTSRLTKRCKVKRQPTSSQKMGPPLRTLVSWGDIGGSRVGTHRRMSCLTRPYQHPIIREKQNLIPVKPCLPFNNLPILLSLSYYLSRLSITELMRDSLYPSEHSKTGVITNLTHHATSCCGDDTLSFYS